MNTTDNLIPLPWHVAATESGAFTLAPTTRVAASQAAVPVAEQLAALLRRGTGFAVPIVEQVSAGDIALDFVETLDGGPEAYQLTVTSAGVRLIATTAAGLFNAVQTLRQLFPPAIESSRTGADDSTNRIAGTWVIPAVEIKDAPRFAYRGLMLDVARNFFTVEEVKEQIDVMAQFKLNALHLHLTDDQAWRIEIHAPENNPSGLDYGKLTEIGGQGAVNHPGVGLAPGLTGYYTQQDFTDIVAYAATKNVLVVPEIDLPGHVNAALAAIPQLNPDGQAKPMNTTGEVGYSTLDAGLPVTYEFVREVLGQVAAITPGPYLHIGGDEALVTGHDNYVAMVQEFARIAAETGKRVVGWNEYADVELPDGAVVQYWHGDFAPVIQQAQDRGSKVIMSPAANTYLDQKYETTSPIGLEWVDGGPFTWSEYYDWNPAQGGLEDNRILGVEGPLWTETVRNNQQAYWLMYPRAISLAEVAWSGQDARDLGDFRRRLGALGERLARQGVTFQAAPDVEWSAVPEFPFPAAMNANTGEYGTIEA
ncbi:beta-N-acetylhexosaminidase [Arthrobacter sp. StoSoilB5]|uniref:beta-N-acetylhexosaminidase n=1 Tax=Arthrobacter sp. StoSoilB5 TaxID=2830992 RepID=UPI001CC70839|nr:beta-N-acetylhexosaminidase [Arthrobacter sp. StoSoilB5]BCW43676.1 beta-N-acetylhexosaminidase [Arthrobacter sp. StoSoilB5]